MAEGCLRGAPACTRLLGYATCRPCGRSGRELRDADTTDGVWIWPEGLAHYLEQREVRPDDPFLAHLRAVGFRPKGPILPAETMLDRLDPGLVRAMTRSQDERTIRLRLPGPSTPRDPFLGVEVDRALGCFRVEVNDAALEAQRRRTDELLSPPPWGRLVLALFGP